MPPAPPADDWDIPAVRKTILALAAANALFWLWTFRFIATHANPKGDGFEWFAAVPFGLAFTIGSLLPALRVIRGPVAGPSIGAGPALTFVVGALTLNVMLFAVIAGAFGDAGRWAFDAFDMLCGRHYP